MSNKDHHRRIISREQVSKHTKVNDLWVIVHGKVYDLSDFVSEHPGGEEILVDEGGRDATEAFENIGHSEDARQLLESFYIGDLQEESGNGSAMKEQSKAENGEESKENFDKNQIIGKKKNSEVDEPKTGVDDKSSSKLIDQSTKPDV